MTFDKAALITLLTTYGVRIIGVIALLLVAYWVAGYAKALIRTALTKAQFDVTLTKFFANGAKWSILIFATVSALGVFGVQAASFAAVIAAVGLAVGLAFQGTLSNFASGVLLLVFRPFGVGDTVKVGGQTGVVDEIDLFTTTLDTPDRRRIILPNSVVASATIENSTYHKVRRVDVDVQTEARHPTDLVRSVLLAAVANIDGALAEPAPNVALNGLSAATNDWQVQVFTPNQQFGAVRERVLFAVRGALSSLPPAPVNTTPSADMVAALKALAAQAPQAAAPH
jgi:small conductance mechanosensitive channel